MEWWQPRRAADFTGLAKSTAPGKLLLDRAWCREGTEERTGVSRVSMGQGNISCGVAP